MTARHTAIAEIASHRVAKTQDYLEDAGALPFPRLGLWVLSAQLR